MCHYRRQTLPLSGVRGAAHDEDPAMRASDADRERAVEALRKHAAAGRLSVGELEERSARAYGARTLADVAPLLADLPEAAPPGNGRGRRARPQTIRQLALLAGVLIAIWAATGFGYFWPLWPILGTLWFARSSRGSFCARGHHRWARPAPWVGPGRFDV